MQFTINVSGGGVEKMVIVDADSHADALSRALEAIDDSVTPSSGVTADDVRKWAEAEADNHGVTWLTVLRHVLSKWEYRQLQWYKLHELVDMFHAIYMDGLDHDGINNMNGIELLNMIMSNDGPVEAARDNWIDADGVFSMDAMVKADRDLWSY